MRQLSVWIAGLLLGGLGVTGVITVASISREQQPEGLLLQHHILPRASIPISSENHTSATRSGPLRVTFCLFGVIPRSIQTTWPAFQARVLDVLQARGAIVEVAAFNIDVGNATVDGVSIDRRDLKLVPCIHCESESQASIDRRLDSWCSQPSCKIFQYPGVTSKNAVRALATEARVSRFLDANKERFDVAIVSSADLYLLFDVRVADVIRSAHTADAVFTASLADCKGYTNGYYIGRPDVVATVMRRMHETKHLDHRYLGWYEGVLKGSFEHSHIHRLMTAQIFFKVRANGFITLPGNSSLEWRGSDRSKDNHAIATFGEFIDKCRVWAQRLLLMWRLRARYPVWNYARAAWDKEIVPKIVPGMLHYWHGSQASAADHRTLFVPCCDEHAEFA